MHKREDTNCKRILFVIRELSGGGAERALSNIVMHMPEEWDIDILMNNRDYIDFPYRGRILSLDIPEPRSRKSPIHQIHAIIKRTFFLRRLKRKNKYKACISFLDSSNISNILSGNKYCKTIVSIRVHMTSEKSNFLYRISAWPLFNLLYKRADKIVTVSKEIEEDIKQRYHIAEQKITSIVNGYDCRTIDEKSNITLDRVLDRRNSKIVVSTGRLEDQKGQWHLIRAFREVIKLVPDARLLILGTGSLKKYLETVIDRNGLGGCVSLMGFCDNPFWYYANADVFILPSMSEGYPNALAEAVCCGAACMATDFCSGAREILAPEMVLGGEHINQVLETEYGILSPLCSGKKYSGTEPLEDAECEMAQGLIDLLQNEAKKLHFQAQSRKRRQDLSINKIIAEWINVIEE